MERIDRRRFLSLGATSLTTAALVGAAGTVSPEGASASPVTPAGAPARPAGLTTTGDTAPAGVDPDQVEFAWTVTDPRRGATQHAYRIVVEWTPNVPTAAGVLVWDSGPVTSGRQSFVRYGGPPLDGAVRYRWTVRTADRAGRWSPPSRPATFTTVPRPADWSASWLRPGPTDPGVECYTYLRTRWGLPAGRLAWAVAFVAAAHRYQLWANGHQTAQGPSFCFPDEQYVQATDVTTVLVPGRTNVVGLLHHWYGPGRGRPASSPGVLAQVVARYVDGRTVVLDSGPAWRTRVAEWLPAPERNDDGGNFVEWIDGRRHPTGWATETFDDSGWTPATVLGPVGTAPFTALVAQRTRVTEDQVPPVAVRTLPNGSVVADFGKIYAGRPTVAFRHGEAGRTVPMTAGYLLDPDGAVSTTHATQDTDMSFSLVQRDGAQVFEPYWYLGFRYFEVDGPGEPLGAEQLTLVSRHAAMPDVAPATFTSSSPELDRVWDLCTRSALFCSQEQFIDTPTREQGQFLWDAANESEVVLRTFGDTNLSWQALRDMAQAQARYWPTTGQVNEIYPNDDGPQDYPTLTARYPDWVWRYYLSTGDAGTLATLLPTLLRLSDYLTRATDPVTGLVSNLTIQTNGDGQYDYDFDTVADTTLNVLAANAYRCIGRIAAVVGDAAAPAQTRLGETLAARINQQLIDPTGRYADGLRSDGSLSSHASQLANASALAYEVCPAGAAARVGAYVSSLDISLQPDHGLELLRGLHAAGRDDDIVRILTDRSFPGWAAILAAGGTFTWETWTPSDLIGDSMSHGWGSAALVAMQEVLLGVTPEPPGPGDPPTVLSVRPPVLTRLDRARGTVPSRAGPVAVAWERDRARLRLTVQVPANARARCLLPTATAQAVTEGGVPIGRAPGVAVSTSGGQVLATVGGGRYEFAVAR